MKIYFKRLYAATILFTAKTPCVTLWDKIGYFLKVIATCGPVVMILDALNIWFMQNTVFMSMVLGAVVINMIVGGVYHKINRTFSWWDFVKGNIKMFLGVFALYFLLELLRAAAGSTIGDILKAVVQTSTLLWPISKSLKNLYIIFDKKFPPAFIMEKLYRFEKTGDIKELINDENLKQE